MAVNQASLDRCLKRTIRLGGWFHPDYPNDDRVAPGAPFTRDFIRDALLMSDNEYCLIVINDLDNPYKSLFYPEEPLEFDDGEVITEHLGTHFQVKIKIAEDSIVKGRQARNSNHFESCRNFPNVYGEPHDLYLIENNIITHFGEKALIYVPDYNIDRESNDGDGALQSPEGWEGGIIAGAFAQMYMPGQDLQQRNFYLAQHRERLLMAQGRVATIPEPEIYQRAGA